MSSVWSIRRSAADRKLAGVCGGVARHWGVDPVLVRVGWALLALSGGLGIVLYVAAWLLVPTDGSTTSVIDDLSKGQTSSWPREAWVAIVAVACLVTFGVFSSTTTIGFGPAVVLALIWYFGYYKNRSRRASPPGVSSAQQTPPAIAPDQSTRPPAEPFRYPGPSTPFTEAAETWRQRVEVIRRSGPDGQDAGSGGAGPVTDHSIPSAPALSWTSQGAMSPVPAADPGWPGYPYGSAPAPVQDPPSAEDRETAARANFLATADPVGLYTEAAPVQAAAAPSRRTQARSLSARRLRLLSLVVLGLALLGLGAADALGATITPMVYAASALLVVGLTLVAATWFGRARGILPIGLLLLVVVAGLSLAGPAAQFTRQVSYPTLAALPAQPLTMDRGLVRVDLRQVDVTRDATFSADVGAGAIEILAPANTNLVLDYTVGNGMVMDNDTTIVSGANLVGSSPLDRRGGTGPTLTLDIEVGHGVVAVSR
ncbi:MAG: PspC domain-containing protein [Microlunatus sp.]|nr:PspC domain-containing protein [Microlunatus sp.]MDN5804948.1 PspC domain-containing protein [Microlunatus sp.]